LMKCRINGPGKGRGKAGFPVAGWFNLMSLEHHNKLASWELTGEGGLRLCGMAVDRHANGRGIR